MRGFGQLSLDLCLTIIFAMLFVEQLSIIWAQTNSSATEISITMQEKEIAIAFDERVIAKIAAEGFDKDFGARPLRRFIADNLEDIFAQKMLKDEVKRGDRVTVTLDSANNISLIKT